MWGQKGCLMDKKVCTKAEKKTEEVVLGENKKFNGQDRKKILLKRKLDHGVKIAPCQRPDLKRLKMDLKFPLNNNRTNKLVRPKIDQQLSRKENEALRQKYFRKRVKLPELCLTEAGEGADLALPDAKRRPLTIQDVQHFIVYSLFRRDSFPPRWLDIKLHKSSPLTRQIFMVIEGVGLNDYIRYRDESSFLKEFETQLEVISPITYGGDTIEELALVPLNDGQKRTLIKEYGSLKAAVTHGDLFPVFRKLFKIAEEPPPNASLKTSIRVNSEHEQCTPAISDKFPRTKLLLSPWEMVENGYPLCLPGDLGERYKNYVYTCDEYSKVTDGSPMWSLDVEMCQTKAGNELTRVSIVNEASQIVYETLVKPYNKITNYITKFSGIYPGMLDDVSTRLEDVQLALRSICPPDLILIGQSLNSDLCALKMMHPYVIDTSVIFNISGVAMYKSKLKVLTEAFLSQKIQDSESGHCPIEDSLAAMKLVQAKLQHSLSWGNAVMGGPRAAGECEAAQALLQARLEAGTARLDTSHMDRVEWPQLTVNTTSTNTSISASTPPLLSLPCVLSSSLFSRLTCNNKNGKEEPIEIWRRYLKEVDVEEDGSREKKKLGVVRFAKVATQKAGTRLARDKGPTDGTTILHVNLTSRAPHRAIKKADSLVGKLLRQTEGNSNTLYFVLLTGHQDNAVAFIHLHRENPTCKTQH